MNRKSKENNNVNAFNYMSCNRNREKKIMHKNIITVTHELPISNKN